MSQEKQTNWKSIRKNHHYIDEELRIFNAHSQKEVRPIQEPDKKQSNIETHISIRTAGNFDRERLLVRINIVDMP